MGNASGGFRFGGSAVAEAKGGGLPCGEEARQAGQSQRTAVDPIYGLSSVGSRPSEDLWMWKAGGFTASLRPFLLGPALAHDILVLTG